MSWADIRKKYRDGGAMASQSTEDMAARRVLRALGVTEKALPAAERAAGLDAKRQADTTLLERAAALAATTGIPALYPLPPVRDVKSPKEADDAVLEYAEQRRHYGKVNPVAIVYRVSGTQDLRAKIWVNDSDDCCIDPEGLPMPCRLYHAPGTTDILADCDAEVYFRHYARMKCA